MSNKCKLYKSQLYFDINKYTCKDCNAIQVNCEYCSSSVRFSGLRAHIKKQHPHIDLSRGFLISMN